MAGHMIVKYETDSGEVLLTPQTVKQYLVSGDPSKVTDQEVMMFLQLCKYRRLNPFLREAYLIKFGTQPATMVVGKDTFTTRAAANPACTGWEAGVVVIKKDGGIEERKGTLVLPGESLVGGWAKAYRKDWTVPIEVTVSLQEYMRMRDGKPMANWATMPATMIRKVALVQALREAMPSEFGGMYAPEEMPVDANKLDDAPVVIDVESSTEEEPAEQPEPEPAAPPRAAQHKAQPPQQEPKMRTILGEIYALAASLKISAAAMKQLLQERYGKTESLKLTLEEAEDLRQYLADMQTVADQNAEPQAEAGK